MSDSASSNPCRSEWCSGEDWCAVTCTMDAIGNKWQPAIVHRLLTRGSMRFGDLAEDLDGLTSSTP